MPKYLYIYHGGEMPETEEQKKEVMDAWGAWFGTLGAALLDGGNPVHPTYMVKSDGSLDKDSSSNPVTGYSVIEAVDLTDAHAKAKISPHLKYGGTIEIGEALDM